MLVGSTLPFRPDEYVPEAATYEPVMSPSSGWSRNSSQRRILPGNMCFINESWTRTGAVITMSNPDHANQAIAVWPSSGSMARYMPLTTQGIPTNDGGVKSVVLSTTTLWLTGSINDTAYTNSNVDTNDVISVCGVYTLSPPTVAPRMRWIIKAE